MHTLVDDVASSGDEELVAGDATLFDEGLEDLVESPEAFARHSDGLGYDSQWRPRLEGGLLRGTSA